MIGIINAAVREFIVDTYGEEQWVAIVGETQVPSQFVSSCPYPDDHTYSVMECLAKQRNLDVDDVLDRCGFYFNTTYIKQRGYDRMLRCMGSNLVEFLQNLNLFHMHLSTQHKAMAPPAFKTEQVTLESLIFHYSSPRPGLTAFAMGLVRGAAKLLYETDITITILARRGDPPDVPGDPPVDSDVFLVRFPPQEGVLQEHTAASTCRVALDPPTVFKLFPFHMVLDKECRLVQVGRGLSRMYPAMKPGRKLSDFFSLRHPYIPFTFKAVRDRGGDTVYVLRSTLNGMELKGQMHYMCIPAIGLERGRTTLDAVAEGAAGSCPFASAAYFRSSRTEDATAAAVPPRLHMPADVRSQALPVLGHSTQTVEHLLLPLSSSTTLCDASAATAAACPAHRKASEAVGHTGSQAVTGPAPAPADAVPRLQVPLAAIVEDADGGASPFVSGGQQPRAPSRGSSTNSLGPRNAGMGRSGLPSPQVEPVLLYMATPRIASMEELRSYGMYVNDMALFDSSREAVLLAEQRTTEAELKETFERLSVQLEEERRRSDSLLYQMIPRHMAESLRRGERVQAETFPEATILFSDIVGFTTISAASTAMEVCNMLDELYNEFDALLDKYPAVYKVETIGDAYMLVCNVTEPCPNHVDVVLDFALDMLRVCGRVKTNAGEPIRIRVGVHTGSVVGGVVGQRMPRFHLFGDTVNTASRMESHGVPGAVHMSAASCAMLREPRKYLITERGEIAVKGKGTMETYLVSGIQEPTAEHLRCILQTSASNPDLLQLLRDPGANPLGAAASRSPAVTTGTEFAAPGDAVAEPRGVAQSPRIGSGAGPRDPSNTGRDSPLLGALASLLSSLPTAMQPPPAFADQAVGGGGGAAGAAATVAAVDAGGVVQTRSALEGVARHVRAGAGRSATSHALDPLVSAANRSTVPRRRRSFYVRAESNLVLSDALDAETLLRQLQAAAVQGGESSATEGYALEDNEDDEDVYVTARGHRLTRRETHDTDEYHDAADETHDTDEYHDAADEDEGLVLRTSHTSLG